MATINEMFAEFEQYMDSLTNEQLGRLIREYIQESQHNGWDGFESHHLVGVAELLSDIKLFGKSAKANEFGKDR